MSEQACMGGWCPVRTSCDHYHAKDRTEPSENLCKDEGAKQWTPIRQVRREEMKEAA